MARYVFITGGVVSSLGKGLASAALGASASANEAVDSLLHAMSFAVPGTLGTLMLWCAARRALPDLGMPVQRAIAWLIPGLVAGTPIVAAAGGVVIVQEYHPAYGNMIEVDHGNQLVTRYAHASRTLVKQGDIVRRGQKIAEIGTTGRSTGPHLHFEVLVQGVFQDPQKFLSAGGTATNAQVAAAQGSAPTQGR